MRKIRSKLKRKSTNLKWKKGQSSTSNPTKSAHRDKAKARLLNVATSSSASGLTEEAVQKLNKIQGRPMTPKIPSAASSFGASSMMDDDSESCISAGVTTVASFMSQFSTHTNASFSKLLNCENLNDRRKEMVAVLAASTEAIKEQNGDENSTEYFLVFTNSLAELEDVNQADPIVGLMAMLIKSVSKAVLQDKFTLARGVFMKLMENFDQNGNHSALIDVNSCVAALLAAQERAKWGSHAVVSLFKALLSFATHSKPKPRKAAIRSTSWLIKNLCGEMGNDEQHLCSKKVAEYCLEFFTATHLDGNPITVLHILGLIESVIGHLHAEDVKVLCEGLLSLSTSSNILVRLRCYEVLYALFDSDTAQLNDTLAGRLIAAIFDLQPDVSDVRQIIAWVTVLKKGYSFLSKRNAQLCSEMFPRFMQICIEDLWPKDQGEINSTATNVIREMLLDVVPRTIEYRSCINTVIASLTQALKNPFGSCQRPAIIIFATVYETCGAQYAEKLKDSLKVLANRNTAECEFRREIESTILAAIKHVDVAIVLSAIPLTDANKEISIDRSWILTLLREGLRNSSLEYFRANIIPLAEQCIQKYTAATQAGNTNQAHIYELLCCQLWGLFPGFCRNPKDVEKFRLLARTCYNNLQKHLHLRAPILDGLKELIPNVIEAGKQAVLEEFAKHYVSLLIELYIVKPNGSYENEMRRDVLKVFKMYLQVTPNDKLSETFEKVLEHLKKDGESKKGEKSKKVNGASESEKEKGGKNTPHQMAQWRYNQLFDITEAFPAHLNYTQLSKLFNEYIQPILSSNSPVDAPKAYQLLDNMLRSSTDECKKFTDSSMQSLIDVIVDTVKLNGRHLMLPRLKCLQVLIERTTPKLESKLMTHGIKQSIMCFPDQVDKSDRLSKEMIKVLGNFHLEHNKLDKFVDRIIEFGMEAEDRVVQTILALKSVLTHFSERLSKGRANSILEKLLLAVKTKQRMVAKAALVALHSYAKYMPRPELTKNLEQVVISLSKMEPDTKRTWRISFGNLLKKLCKYYTAQEIIKIVPGNDLVTHKRLKKIRKELNKSKASSKNDKDSESENEDDLEIDEKLKTITIGDVLKDSESEFSDSDDSDEDDETSEKKEKMDVCIHEDADTIVDLADANAVSKITTKTKKKKNQRSEKKAELGDIKFKTAQDGRLIIEEPKKKDLLPKPGSKRQREESGSESEDEEEKPQATNKKLKGIHRVTGSGMSVASAKSGKSWKSMQSTKSSKKADKALKKKANKGKFQPYAYEPLKPNKKGHRKNR